MRLQQVCGVEKGMKERSQEVGKKKVGSSWMDNQNRQSQGWGIDSMWVGHRNFGLIGALFDFALDDAFHADTHRQTLSYWKLHAATQLWTSRKQKLKVIDRNQGIVW